MIIGHPEISWNTEKYKILIIEEMNIVLMFEVYIKLCDN